MGQDTNTISNTTENKIKCKKRNMEYINYGFITPPTNRQLPMGLFSGHFFTPQGNETLTFKERITKIHLGGL